MVDQLGNEATLDREVRIVDTTAPVITLNDDGGINFLNIKTGHPFVDPGAVVRDNYDSSPTVVKSIQSIVSGQVLSEPAGGEIFQTLENIGFWEAGSYKVVYQSTDSNGNTGSKERNLVVQDTLPPDMVAITHQFLANPSISLTSYQDATKTIIGPTSPLPTEISTSLNQLSGYDGSLLTFNRSTPTPTTSPVRVISTSNIPKLTVSSTIPGPDRQLFRQRMLGEGSMFGIVRSRSN